MCFTGFHRVPKMNLMISFWYCRCWLRNDKILIGLGRFSTNLVLPVVTGFWDCVEQKKRLTVVDCVEWRMKFHVHLLDCSGCLCRTVEWTCGIARHRIVRDDTRGDIDDRKMADRSRNAFKRVHPGLASIWLPIEIDSVPIGRPMIQRKTAPSRTWRWSHFTGTPIGCSMGATSLRTDEPSDEPDRFHYSTTLLNLE